MSTAVQAHRLERTSVPMGSARSRSAPRWALAAAATLLFFAVELNPSAAWSEERALPSEATSVENVEDMASAAERGTLKRQVPLLLLGLWGALALARGRGERLSAAGALPWLVVGYLTLLAASVLWSTDVPLTARRLAGFLMMAVAIAATVRAYSAADVVTWALLASAAFVAVALGYELWTGAFQPSNPDHRFSGVYHPNTLGAFCAILAMAATATAPRARHRLLLFGVAGAAAALLVLTDSRTALVGLVLALCAQWLGGARASRAAFAAVVVAWAVSLALFLGGDSLFAHAGDALLTERHDAEPLSFTGRTFLWDVLLDRVAERPLLGHGFGAFWTPGNVQGVYRSAGWAAAHAHSTYIEQLLEIGVVGAAIYVLVSLSAVGRAVTGLRRTRDGGTAFMLSLLVYCLVVGAFETVEPSPRFLTFLFFWAVAFLAFRGTARAGGAPQCASTSS